MKKSIQELAEVYAAQSSQLKETLKDLLKSLPETAEGVRRLSPNCCTVPLSVIAKNHGVLSSGYYLHREVKEVLLKIVDKSSLEALTKKIEEIIQTGRLRSSPGQWGYAYNEKLPEEFITALKAIWEA